MIYRVRHITEYEYASSVTLCYNITHLLPRNTLKQRVKSSKITVLPKPIYQRERVDYFGNQTFYFSLQEAHKKLSIDVVSEIEIEPFKAGWSIDFGPTCGEALTQMKTSTLPEILDAREYTLNSPMIKCSSALAAFGQNVFLPNKSLMQAVKDFTTKIFTEFTFDPQSTTIATPLNEVLENKRGVCQDFAHFAIGVLRSLGFAARYMSGYIETLPPPGQERLVGADASHAWFAIYIPNIGWVESDPTNDVLPNDQHIVTAWGRDYSDVTPIQGVIFDGGDSQTLNVSVDVERIGH